jgi:hypothetical protein
MSDRILDPRPLRNQDELQRAIPAFFCREQRASIGDLQHFLRAHCPAVGCCWLGEAENVYFGLDLSSRLEGALAALLRKGWLDLLPMSPDHKEFGKHWWLVPPMPVATAWPEEGLAEPHWLPILLVPGPRDMEAPGA